MNWLNHDSFAVWGLGVSGIASANLLARRGKRVIASDTRSLESMTSVREALDPRIELVGGGNVVDSAQVVVASPGLPPTLDVFKDLKVPVVSEIEIAFDAAKCRFLAITGTDGKTTTTALTAHILEAAGLKTMAAGNIGTPLCEVVESFGANDVIVAEVSAFQLWSTHHFHAEASAFTNIAEDHLDYFPSFDEYVAAKRRLIAFSTAEDWAILNMGDSHIRHWGEGFVGTVATYGLTASDSDNHLWFDGELIRRNDEVLWRFDGCQLKGAHNALNMMAATHLALRAGVDMDVIADAMATFRPLAHRVEPVRVVVGVAYLDDSKATNAHAAMAGIRSLEGDLVVIAGGVDKGLDLVPFCELLAARAKAVVVIGDIATRLTDSLERAGHTQVVSASTMEEAVQVAQKLAAGQGSVLLSPACSSFDMFRSYAHRGDVFQDAVRALKA